MGPAPYQIILGSPSFFRPLCFMPYWWGEEPIPPGPRSSVLITPRPATLMCSLAHSIFGRSDRLIDSPPRIILVTCLLLLIWLTSWGNFKIVISSTEGERARGRKVWKPWFQPRWAEVDSSLNSRSFLGTHKLSPCSKRQGWGKHRGHWLREKHWTGRWFGHFLGKQVRRIRVADGWN